MVFLPPGAGSGSVCVMSQAMTRLCSACLTYLSRSWNCSVWFPVSLKGLTSSSGRRRLSSYVTMGSQHTLARAVVSYPKRKDVIQRPRRKYHDLVLRRSRTVLHIARALTKRHAPLLPGPAGLVIDAKLPPLGRVSVDPFLLHETPDRGRDVAVLHDQDLHAIADKLHAVPAARVDALVEGNIERRGPGLEAVRGRLVQVRRRQLPRRKGLGRFAVDVEAAGDVAVQVLGVCVWVLGLELQVEEGPRPAEGGERAVGGVFAVEVVPGQRWR